MDENELDKPAEDLARRLLQSSTTSEDVEILHTLLSNGFDITIVKQSEAIHALANRRFEPDDEPDYQTKCRASQILYRRSRTLNTQEVPSAEPRINGIISDLARMGASCSVKDTSIFLTTIMQLDPTMTLSLDTVKYLASTLCDKLWSTACQSHQWELSESSCLCCVTALCEYLELEQLPRGTPVLNGSENGDDHDRIRILLAHIGARTLACQLGNGAWSADGDMSSTANNVLILCHLVGERTLEPIHDEMRTAIAEGRKYLSVQLENLTSSKGKTGENEYAKPSALALCLAALKKNPPKLESKSGQTLRNDDSSQTIRRLGKFFSQLRDGEVRREVVIKGAVVEGLLYMPLLLSLKNSMFPQTTAKDEYIPFICTIWSLVNNHHFLGQSPAVLFELMAVSLFDYLVDEYLESVASRFDKEELRSFSRYLQLLACPRSNESEALIVPNTNTRGEASAFKKHMLTKSGSSNGKLDEACSVLEKFISSQLTYHHYVTASTVDQDQLRVELCYFLTSHVQQLLDNKRLSAQRLSAEDSIGAFVTPRSSYSSWVQTTGTGHSAAPYSFAFYCCMVSSWFRGNTESFPQVSQKYLAYTLMKQLAALSRMYNDYSSFSRDVAEHNLNSLNFPEFGDQGQPHGWKRKRDDNKINEAKTQLLELGRFERSASGNTLKLLVDKLQAQHDIKGTDSVISSLRLFVYVTHLFADVYLLKDVTNRVTKTGPE